MESVYAVSSCAEYEWLRRFAERNGPLVREYADYLKRNYAVCDLPRTIVWTTREIACEQIGNFPVPAYTNDFRVVFAPDVETWRALYLCQLEGCAGKEEGTVRSYYETELNENHVLQILGHELAHHSDWFSDEAYETGGAWFEEGMVEYISRRFFLTEHEFDRQKEINRLLVTLYEKRRGKRAPEQFGQKTDNGDFAALYYDYWRAFLRVCEMVDARGGDARTLLREYGQNRNA